MKKKLLPKKMLATYAALLLLLTLMPMTARATVISSESITKTSTVYVGEVVVDGVTQIKYLYSDDLTLSGSVRYNLLDGLNGMADSDYATLFVAYWPASYPPQSFAFCSDPNLIEVMDGNWNSAQYVGMLYFPDKSVISEINTNLYDVDEGFRAALDAQTQESIEFIDTPAIVEKCIVSHIGSHAYDNVYYTVENGQAVKHVDTYITYDCEATTVIYTKVELGASSINISLADNSDNTSTLTTNNGVVATVTLADRTLWKDGNWNTLCLPFDLTIADSPLDGDNVDVRTLDSAVFDGETGTLTLNFTEEGDVSVVNAGTPFIIKWDNTGVNLTENDLVFPGVTIYNELHDVVFDLDTENPGTKGITFKGTYAYRSFDDTDPSILFLETNNELCYPEAGGHIGAQRAYFQLNGLTAAQPQPGQTSINAFVLNFGGETGIVDTDFKSASQESGISNPLLQTWFTLDGKKLYDKSKAKGIYINNGKKVIIK